jgi:hypothetical protein
MPDILAMLVVERNKLNRAIEALSVGIGTALGRMARLEKRTMSTAARARISAAQKARWAKSKGQIAVAMPKKRTMSPEARARIAAGARARWARAKGQSAAKPVKKKFTMSVAAKAKISKAMKARWAAKKKGV